MYKVRAVLFLEAREISPEMLYDLGEFLRTNMITPFIRNEGLCEPRKGEKREAYFSAGFTEVDAEKVCDWLDSQGVIVCCETTK